MIGHGPALTHLADFVNGYGFTGDDLDGDGIPVVRIQHLLDPSVEMDRTDLDVPQVAIQPGDLVFSWSATLAARIWDREPALLNQHLFRVDPHSGVDRRWLKYVLDVAVDALSGHMHGSAMTHITRDMMRRVRVPFRSLQMQRAIADYLDTETARIDALIAKKRRMIELLEEAHRASVTLAIAPGGTWGDGHAGKADLPQGWDRPRFGSVVSVAEGQVDPRIEPWRSMLMIAPNHT
ncbi:MAG: restriction endonuclease subunit S [Acidimicrobiia bacterium]|nr:restriction endonuclease subunit S [Acidimicrobiia bacterium]